MDEYDKPLLAAMDGFIRFVLITGVTKFSKISIFSDLNQLRDISLLPKYAALCGITEKELKENFTDEVKETAESLGQAEVEVCRQLADMYDGYHFSNEGEGVYNPFSLLSAFADKRLGRYWFETGTPSFLIRSISRLGISLQDFTDGISATADEMMNFHADAGDAIPLFYQSGYLTIKGYDEQFEEYTLSFPNEEVKYGFFNSLVPTVNASYMGKTGKFSVGRMTRYLQTGDTDSFMQMLQALLASIPYYEGKVPKHEQQWRNLLYVVFSLLGQYVSAEVHSAQGRSDCAVETDRYVYLFEFKEDKTAEEALRQIEDNGYAVPYLSSGKQIVKIGADFSSKLGTLDEWKSV